MKSDIGIDDLMLCARLSGALEGDEAALLHLLKAAVEMGYWRAAEEGKQTETSQGCAEEAKRS